MRRRGGAHRPLQEISRFDDRFTHEVFARRRWVQGHEWPRSTICRGAAVLRLDVQHSGKFTWRRASMTVVQLRAETKEEKR
jgi:hypothetical protein